MWCKGFKRHAPSLYVPLCCTLPHMCGLFCDRRKVHEVKLWDSERRWEGAMVESNGDMRRQERLTVTTPKFNLTWYTKVSIHLILFLLALFQSKCCYCITT
jgi:hypothetical protein